MASLAAGAAFYRWVEAPLGRVLAGLSKPMINPTFSPGAARGRAALSESKH
jgi:hypothetical protein